MEAKGIACLEKGEDGEEKEKLGEHVELIFNINGWVVMFVAY